MEEQQPTARERLIAKKFLAAEKRRKVYEERWSEYAYAYQMITSAYGQKRLNGDDPFTVLSTLESESALSQINLPVEFSVIIRKTAEEMRNLPNYKWISMSKDDPKVKGELFSNVFAWVWYEAKGDVEIFKTLLAKNIYGTSWAWAFHEDRTVLSHIPYKEEGEVKFAKKDTRISRTRFINVDIRDVYVDPGAIDIEDAEYAFVAKFYTEDIARAQLENCVKKSKYKWGDFRKTSEKQRSYPGVAEGKEALAAEYYSVKYYYNQILDEYVITIDDKIIHDSHIPAAPDDGIKRIPLAQFTDHVLDGELYGQSESAIVKPHREVKNNLTNLTFDVSRQSAFGTIAVSPYAEFDEDGFEWGQPFLRVEPGSLQQIQVNANLSWANAFADYMENQMIVSTGINHMDVAQNGQETATKSLQRRESQMLIVEAGMKFNTVTGFTRLALLLKDLIRLHYKSYPINSTETAPRKVRLKDMKFVRNKKTGKLGSEKTSGFTYFDILPEDLEDDLDLVLELGNVAMSKSLEMDLQLLGIDRLLSLPPTMTPEGQQKPVYKPEELAKFIQSKFSLPQEILDDEEDATNNLEKEAKDGLLYKQDDPKDFIKGAEMAQMGQPVPTMPDAMGGRFPAGAIGGGNPAVGNTVGTP